MESDGIKNKVLQFAENHPYILLAVISILVIIIIIMYLDRRGYIGKSGFKVSRKKKEESDTEEIDDLIDSIHKKQKLKSE